MVGKTLGEWVFFAVKVLGVVVLSLLISFSLLTYSNYRETVDRFVFYVKIEDEVRAKDELVKLHYFYDLSKKWKVQWLADKYFFQDSLFYEAASRVYSCVKQEAEAIRADKKAREINPEIEVLAYDALGGPK